MLKSIFISILLLFSTSYLYSQTVSGTITDSLDVPVQYASIGVKGENIGTVSDDKGKFSLNVSNVKEDAKIVISNISYKVKEYSLKEFLDIINSKKPLIVEENNQQLQEVVVSSKEFKKDNLGNTTTSSFVVTGFSDNALGNEIGIRIKIKNKPTYIDAFNFCPVFSENDSLFFRLNIYSIKDDMPNENLLSENIYFSTDIKKGKVSVDLTKYNIQVNEDVIVAIEYVKELGKGGLFFSGSLFGNKLYHRQVNVDEWEKEGMISIGFNVDVRY